VLRRGLFDSATKFESGTDGPVLGPAGSDEVRTETDTSHGMRRVEALCAQCDAHWGMFFPDGPPTARVFA